MDADEMKRKLVDDEKEEKEGEALPQGDAPKSTVGKFELPCGYLDPQGVLHTEISLTEMDGNDEDLMFSNLSSHQIVDDILKNRVLSLGTLDAKEASKVVRDLLTGDRVFLMIALRRLSQGDLYEWVMKCSDCGEKSKMTLDLSTLDVKKMANPKQRVFDDTLPRSGLSVRWKAMNGNMEAQRDRAKKNVQKDRATFAIYLRLESLGGKPTMQMPDVKKLNAFDRQYLRNRFDEFEGGVETDLELKCPNCQNEIETELDITQRSFFFPTKR